MLISKLIPLIFLILTPIFSFGQINVNEKSLKKDIFFLASDKMKGRETGSREVMKAARYIEKRFKKLGLTPKGDKGFRQSFPATIRKVVVRDSLRAADNIIGYLDNGAEKTIVIGAHYDHLGHGTIGGSRDTLHVGEIHNGADDNASGVAGLLALAEYYAENDIKESHNILFIAFGAEELGLIGSKYYTEHPTIPLDQTLWMLNMDMIGRYNPDNGVAIIGYGTSPSFVQIFDGVTSDIKFYTSRDGNGGSDNTSFYKNNIPVLFFHTGGHDDYHKASDDPEKINYSALKSIIELESKVVDNSMEVNNMEFTWTN